MTNSDSVNRSVDERDVVGHFQLYEIDRQIKSKLRSIEEENKKKKNQSVVGSIASLIKKRVIERKTDVEQDDPSRLISITDSDTMAYQQLRRAVADIHNRAELIDYENQRVLFLSGQPQIGDMRYFRPGVATINLSINGEHFLISPHYIFRFDTEGQYKCTYSPLAMGATLVTYSKKDKKEISRTLKRDLFRKEKGISSFTNKDLIDNVLKLEIAELTLFYVANTDFLRGIAEVVSAYSDTEISEEFDPAFHIMGLLKRCDFESKNVKRLESLVAKHKT